MERCKVYKFEMPDGRIVYEYDGPVKNAIVLRRLGNSSVYEIVLIKGYSNGADELFLAVLDDHKNDTLITDTCRYVDIPLAKQYAKLLGDYDFHPFNNDGMQKTFEVPYNFVRWPNLKEAFPCER